MLWSPLIDVLETMHRRICPLYSFDDATRAQIVGSAVPFNSGGFPVLITARHVLLQGGSRRSLPVFTMGEIPRVLTGRRIVWDYNPGVTPDLDLALVELTDEEASDLEKTYQFTTPAGTSTTKPKTPGIHYVLTGYPASRNRFVSPRSYPSARATHLTTGDIVDVSTLAVRDKTDETHFALGLPYREVPRMGGGRFTIPKAAGMSGGGVWMLEIDIPARLATTPLLVGIGIEHHRPRGFFVATRVQQAIPLLHDLIGFVKAGVWPSPDGG